MIGTTIRHPDYDGATVVSEFRTSAKDRCYVIDWQGQHKRVTADSCRPAPIRPVGKAPSGNPERKRKTAKPIPPKKPNGRCGAHTPHPVSIYRIAQVAGVSRAAVQEYADRHGYEAAVARYSSNDTNRDWKKTPGGPGRGSTYSRFPIPIATIAFRAGVAAATVSRHIRNFGYESALERFKQKEHA